MSLTVGSRVCITKTGAYSAPVFCGDTGTVAVLIGTRPVYAVLMDKDGKEWQFHDDVLKELVEGIELVPQSYRASAMRTATHDYSAIRNRFLDSKIMLTNAALGLTGEAGEFADLIKKIVFHGKGEGRITAELRDKMIKELGDIRWYLELAAYALDVPMEEIERLNIAKLEARYPTGFSEAAAEARVDTLPPGMRAEVLGTGKTMDELRRDNTSGCSCCTDDGFYYECDEHKKGGAV